MEAGEAKRIAEAVTDRIWSVGELCGQEEVRRIAFKHGDRTSLDYANERESGGLCRKAFLDYVYMACIGMDDGDAVLAERAKRQEGQ